MKLFGKKIRLTSKAMDRWFLVGLGVEETQRRLVEALGEKRGLQVASRDDELGALRFVRHQRAALGGMMVAGNARLAEDFPTTLYFMPAHGGAATEVRMVSGETLREKQKIANAIHGSGLPIIEAACTPPKEHG